MLFVSGTSSRRSNNTHIGAIEQEDGSFELNIRDQTRAVFENIKVILNHAGASLEHCVQLTVFLVNIEGDYRGMNEVYNEYFDQVDGPTRTTVQVAALPHRNLLIEIQAIAAKPTEKNKLKRTFQQMKESDEV